jgi:hypothetical protein
MDLTSFYFWAVVISIILFIVFIVVVEMNTDFVNQGIIPGWSWIIFAFALIFLVLAVLMYWWYQSPVVIVDEPVLATTVIEEVPVSRMSRPLPVMAEVPVVEEVPLMEPISTFRSSRAPISPMIDEVPVSRFRRSADDMALDRFDEPVVRRRRSMSQPRDNYFRQSRLYDDYI